MYIMLVRTKMFEVQERKYNIRDEHCNKKYSKLEEVKLQQIDVLNREQNVLVTH